MFNRYRFNYTPYNRHPSLNILLSATMDGEGSLSAYPSARIHMSASFDGEGTMTSEYLRKILAAFVAEGEGSLSTVFIREIVNSAVLNGEGTLSAYPKKMHVDSLLVVGDFASGDKITVDSRMLRVLRNGEYVPYDGDFFDLHPGDNEIMYTDEVTGRSIRVRVTWRDRYL